MPAAITKIALTGWLTNDSNLFLRVLEAGGLRSGCQPNQVWEGPLLACRLLIISSHGTGGEGSLCGLFYKSTNPTHEGSPSEPNHLPKLPPPNTISAHEDFNV